MQVYHVSISSTFYACIFLTKVCSKPNSKQRKAAQKTFMQKTCAKNVDEIDSKWQFHQHLTGTFLYESALHSFPQIPTWL